MASKMLKVPRVVAYSSSLKLFAQNVRTFSSKLSVESALPPSLVEEQMNTEKQLPGREISLMGPIDFRAPLPGNVGIAPQNFYSRVNEIEATTKTEPFKIDVLTRELPEDRNRNVLLQFFNLQTAQQESLGSSKPENSPAPGEVLEFIAQDCPTLMKKDFQDLFPGRDLQNDNLTVLTICQRTKNDMSIWNEDVESEREELTEHFVSAAQDICEVLKKAGYWADFIDPSSGKPYLGPNTNATLFETDERYRHLGFTIEDLGCCKVVFHHLWNTHAFVCCLFTNAPLESPEVESLLQKQMKKSN